MDTWKQSGDDGHDGRDDPASQRKSLSDKADRYVIDADRDGVEVHGQMSAAVEGWWLVGLRFKRCQTTQQRPHGP
jgi:hypothetical protein